MAALGLFIYAFVLQRPYFAQVHLLAIFLALGVGADDIFVFMDAWRQSQQISGLTTLAERMHYTLAKRTFFTVLNTSATVRPPTLNVGPAGPILFAVPIARQPRSRRAPLAPPDSKCSSLV